MLTCTSGDMYVVYGDGIEKKESRNMRNEHI